MSDESVFLALVARRIKLTEDCEKACVAVLLRFIHIITALISSFFNSSAKFSKFDAGNVILFQIKIFGRNIKETTLGKYFIKVTARPSFTRLRVIRRINRIH